MTVQRYDSEVRFTLADGTVFVAVPWRPTPPAILRSRAGRGTGTTRCRARWHRDWPQCVDGVVFLSVFESGVWVREHARVLGRGQVSPE